MAGIVFSLLIIGGTLYLAAAILIMRNPQKARVRFQKSIQPVKTRLMFPKTQSVLNKTGIRLPANYFMFIRYGTAIAYIILTVLTNAMRGYPFDHSVLWYSLLWILITSPMKYAPLGWVLVRMQLRNRIRKDGELLSFLKLYQNNRMRNHAMQFWAFCSQVAPYFEFISKDLERLSVRVIDDGIEEALDWFVQQYPKEHPFIYDIRNILLTAESLKDEEEVYRYLQSQQAIISKLAADQFDRRWSMIADVTKVVNAIPSLGTFLMIIVLSLIYLTIIKNQLGGM